jgi:hypothetical protein
VIPTSSNEVQFTTWREDIYDESFELVKKDALCLRASFLKWDFHTVLWDETEEELEECKILLTMQIRIAVQDSIVRGGDATIATEPESHTEAL